MKSIISFLTLFLFTANLFAQSENGSIKGRITDGGDQKIINSATISLLKFSDSALVKVALADKQGDFEFDNVPFGTYFLKATSVGHLNTYSAALKVENQIPVNVGILKLEKNAQTLATVTIDIKKPFIERKIDRTVINVDASITNAGTSALEVLEKSPGVSVDKDGNVSLKGKQGVMILMDGRPSYLSGQELSNLLKNMPSSGIDQIEIMTNPSAKFDAAGNSGVINIKTKKNKMKGFNGSITAGVMQSNYTKTNNSLNLNYRSGKVNIFGNYSYSLWQSENIMKINRKFRNSDSKAIESIFDQKNTSNNRSQNHNAKIGMDFYANKKTTLGVVFSGYDNPITRNRFNRTNLNNSQNVTDSISTTQNDNKANSNNFATNLNLRHSFDSTGKEFTIDLDYVSYDQKNNMQMKSNYLNPDLSERRPSSYLTGNLPSKIDIYSAKSDFIFPLKNQDKIELGVKSSYVNTDNDAIYKTGDIGKEVIDNGKTNHFIYKENINAAYVNYGKQAGKWGIQAGLRAENTNAKGYQLGNESQSDSSFTKSYVNLFPTIYVSYKVNDKNTLSANYGRRVDRPGYEDLNPFYYFLDEYTYSVGNTLLQPQFSNNIEVTHTYNGFLNTTLNYSETKDAFTQVLKQNTIERITYQTNENLAIKRNYGIAVSANVPIMKFWNSNLYANFNNNYYRGIVNGGLLEVSNDQFTANMNNQFKLNKGWSAELSGFYRSKAIEGQIVVDEVWRLDAGIQKQILKNKGTLKFSVRDLFNSMGNVAAYIKYQDIDLVNINQRASRDFSITFSYRFGKPIKGVKSRKSGGASDEQNRVKSGN